MAAKQYPISIRFLGEEFDNRSVPIYELGEVLLSLQRMINQAYLLFSSEKSGEEDESTTPRMLSIRSKKIRQQLSLQLAGRETGSDVYNLTWFANDIEAADVDEMLSYVSSGTAAYANQEVYDGSLMNPIDTNASAFYNDVTALTNRITGVGNIEGIEFSIKGHNTPIMIDKGTKEYVKQLRNLQYLGKEPDTFSGKVVTARVLPEKTVDVYAPAYKRNIRAWVGEERFQQILTTLAKDENHNFKFKGNPRLKIGYLESDFREFIDASYPPELIDVAAGPAGPGGGRPGSVMMSGPANPGKGKPRNNPQDDSKNDPKTKRKEQSNL